MTKPSLYRRCECAGQCGQTHMLAAPSATVRPVPCNAPLGERIVRHTEFPGSWVIRRFAPEEFLGQYTKDVTRVELRAVEVGGETVPMCDRCAALTERGGKQRNNAKGRRRST